jgi:predicted nucleic acid-binding protein
MVLPDTSVWIDYFNGRSNWQTERLDLLLDTELVALGDLILTEVLQGFRNERDFRKARHFFPSYHFTNWEAIKCVFRLRGIIAPCAQKASPFTKRLTS